MVSIVGKRGSRLAQALAHADPAGSRRGNTTSGADRRGWKGGRIPVYPDGTITWPLAIRHLSDREISVAILLGNGNPAKGIRRALNTAVLDERDEGAPMTRFEAENWVKLRKLAAKAGPTTPKLETDKEFAPLIGGLDWDDEPAITQPYNTEGDDDEP